MKDILSSYRNDCYDEERLNSQAGQVELLTTMYYLKRVCPNGCDILDACAGTGLYSFLLANQGYKVTAGDLLIENVEKIRNRQKANPILHKIYESSITNLEQFQNESFDVVLNLGDHYHLCDYNKRMQAIKENLRVLKKDGIYIMSYINRYTDYISHCTEMNDDSGLFAGYLNNGYLEDKQLFYAATPEIVEQEMKQFPLIQTHNIATDGPIFIYRDSVDKMTRENFDEFLQMHLKVCEVRSILRYSGHGLYIGNKLR